MSDYSVLDLMTMIAFAVNVTLVAVFKRSIVRTRLCGYMSAATLVLKRVYRVEFRIPLNFLR